ncbi:CBS domain-containing protein [Desulfofarcimen acetoxidans DSM 771]|jgi:CBS domain-containing protein|uniref:CBS domain-containing protein n=1 Tax=Desulfofarcimen acetoxidans (strain ATCC 49208 / DSM 771 / KCTC 5769 / VKM B-1644 / 5575) TaxID=485916 RepID=C8W5P7_DESAS|nr:CBS domain-containing protein [Desulfofarcimen acetoxidans]ACV64047.1 CBS domain-containing protein [Desulfofarcimen acetoxidans DSM 771]
MAQSLQEIMSKNVATITPQQTVAEAAQLMSQHNIGSLPVVENGQCVGMLTDRDITLRAAAKGANAATTKVGAVMTKEVITAAPQMDVNEASKLMADKQIRRLPVVENNQVTGIVAIGDIAAQSIYQDEAGEALSDISKSPATLS